MIKVVIVDDDTINRAAIATMIDWESLDCKVVNESENGKNALEYIIKNKIDILITDMKMPIMDGLELIENIKQNNIKCTICVISSYNEFDMVREAFKLGIEDYFLKSELNENSFYKFICKIKNRIINENLQEKNEINKNIEALDEYSIEQELKNAITGTCKKEDNIFKCGYIIAIWIDDVDEIRKRFVNIKKELIIPIYELLKQIPKIKKEGIITNYSEKKIIMFINAENEESIINIGNRIISVIHNFMNIDISIGISSLRDNTKSIAILTDEAINNASLQYVFGMNKVFTNKDASDFGLNNVLKNGDKYLSLLNCVKKCDLKNLSIVQNKILDNILNLNDIIKEVMHIIYLESVCLEENGDYIWNAFVNKSNYEEKLCRNLNMVDVKMWITNFNKWIIEYLNERYNDSRGNSFILTATEYIDNNYSNSAFGLKDVSEYMGLNEQYFCSKFRKEQGISFIEYLSNIRIEKAKELIKCSNMKIYEICEAVGYNSVEHFGRVFRKKTGVSPGAFK